MYFSDEPITKPEDDEFSRGAFVERLSESILDWRSQEDSLVMALCGPWGTGKSSILNLLELQLVKQTDQTPDAAKKNIKVVRFDPWFFNSTEELLQTYFSEINRVVSQLIEKKEFDKLASTIRKYTKMLSFAPEISFGLLRVKMPTKPREDVSSPESLRKELRELLKNIDGSVVVLIDNLDRLDQKELLLVFKLIRLCSDFPKFIYLLAFSKKQVLATLGDERGIDPEFLSKIVQVTIDLPQIDQEQIDEFVYKGVNEITSLHEIEFEENVAERFAPLYQRYVSEHLICDLRSAKRYLNAIAFSMPLVKGEVNFADFLVSEMVRVFFPVVYRELPSYKSEFTELDLLISSAGGDLDRRQRHEVFRKLQAWLGDTLHNSKEVEIIEGLLGFLFPTLGAFIANPQNPTYITHEYGSIYEKEQRITAPTHFDRYFRFQVPRDDIPSTIVRGIIATINSEEHDAAEDETGNIWNEFRERNQLRNLFKKLILYIDEVSPEGKERVVISISQYSKRLDWSEKGFFVQSEAWVARRLLFSCLSQGEDPRALEERVGEVVRSATSLSFASLVIEGIGSHKKKGELPAELEIAPLLEIISDRIRSEIIQAEQNIFIEYPDSFARILAIWHSEVYLGEQKEADEYVYAQLRNYPKGIGQLLRLYGLSYLASGEPAELSYSDIAGRFDVHELYAVASAHKDFPDWSQAEQFAVDEFLSTYEEQEVPKRSN